MVVDQVGEELRDRLAAAVLAVAVVLDLFNPGLPLFLVPLKPLRLVPLELAVLLLRLTQQMEIMEPAAESLPLVHGFERVGGHLVLVVLRQVALVALLVQDLPAVVLVVMEEMGVQEARRLELQLRFNLRVVVAVAVVLLAATHSRRVKRAVTREL